jgi:raffinose/stachyose/melibiose transport system substrate-binding protein
LTKTHSGQISTRYKEENIMSLKRKVFSAALSAAIAATMMAPAMTASAEETTSITYWSMWEATEPQGKAIQEACDAYAEETGITVNVEFKGRTGQREGLEPALEAGTAIDLFDEDIDRVNGTWGKYLMDLEELAASHNYEETANAGLMAACRDAAGGTLKSIPYQPNVFAFFYNKTIFDEAGVTEVPTTWAELKDVCQKIKDAGYIPMTMDDAYATSVLGYHLGRLVGEPGVREIVTEGKWDDPAVLRAAQDIEELATAGYFSEMVGSNVWPAGQNSELAVGTAAMYLNGSWLPNEVKDIAGEDFQWGCFAYPAVDPCETNLEAEGVGATGVEANNFGAQVFAINKDSKNAEAAFGLIEKITKGEYDQKLADASIGIPADTTNTEWPALVSCAKPVIDASTSRFTWAVGVEANEDITPVIKENTIKLMAGTCTAQEFVDTMVAAAK